MKKVLALLICVSCLIAGCISVSAAPASVAELSQAANEPIVFFDFSQEDKIVERGDDSSHPNVYTWRDGGLLVLPTGANVEAIDMEYNDEWSALQMNFNGQMSHNLSCLWLGLGGALELDPENAYYVAIRYRYMKDGVTGFLSEDQCLAGYSSVNNYSESNPGGRVLYQLTKWGMPTLQDGDWLVTFMRISIGDKFSDYEPDRANIGVIRTSLDDKISNESVLVQSIGIFQDTDLYLANLPELTEENVAGLRSTVGVYFAMRENFVRAQSVEYKMDETHVKSVKWYKAGEAEGSWNELEGKPTEDGSYKVEIELEPEYWFEASVNGASEHTMTREFTVGAEAEVTAAANATPSGGNNAGENASKTTSGKTAGEDSDKGGFNKLFVIIPVCVVVAAAAVVAALVLKKKKK